MKALQIFRDPETNAFRKKYRHIWAKYIHNYDLIKYPFNYTFTVMFAIDKNISSKIH